MLEPLVAQHQGRIFKVTGDGVLVEFGSAVNAVQCAVDLQHEMATANARSARGSPHRAAHRRQSRRRHGRRRRSLWRWRQYRFASRRLSPSRAASWFPHRLRPCQEQGERRLRRSRRSELEEHRRAGARLPCRWHAAPCRAPATAATDKPSIAVLPFEQHERRSGAAVFQRRHHRGHHHRTVPVPQLLSSSLATPLSSSGAGRRSCRTSRRELGVRYVVEGSVRRLGPRPGHGATDRCRTRQPLWAEHYDRDLQDIFAVQDDVVDRITTTLVGELEQDRAKRQSQSALRAYDLYLRGREHFFNWSADENRKAAELLEAAIAIDPDYAAVLALRSEVHQRDWLNGWSRDAQKDLSESYSKAAKAVQLDDGDSRTHTSLGLVHLFTGEPDRAKHHIETALRLNPNDTRALVYLARHATLNGEPERAVEIIHRALQLNPFGKYNWYLGIAKFVTRHYDEVVDLLRNVRNPGRGSQPCWQRHWRRQAGATRQGPLASAFLRSPRQTLSCRI